MEEGARRLGIELITQYPAKDQAELKRCGPTVEEIVAAYIALHGSAPLEEDVAMWRLILKVKKNVKFLRLYVKEGEGSFLVDMGLLLCYI